MKPQDLVTLCARARDSADPLAAMRELLESLSERVDEIERALDYIPGTGGNAHQVFYRAPDLTLLKVRFPAGRRTPPHDHGTWASILLLSGGEKNTLYRTDGGTLRRASEVTLERGSILNMREETAHVAECVGAEPAVGLHVYGGDIFRLPRRMWHPQTLEAHALDWGLYENFARIASAAPGAPAA
jgi:predicted metal-dependent enzyme (double-stranded beta helix superfamily)